MQIYPNNWIRSVTLEKMSTTVYDALIIGSGAGGGAVLYRLCELWRNQEGLRIGLLEKGAPLFHSHALNIPTMNITRMRDKLWNDNSTHLGARLPMFSGARMTFALGGRMLLWNAISPRPLIQELLSWPVDLNELNFYFRLAEKIMNVSNLYTEGSSLQKALLNRLWSAGFTEATDLPLAIDLSGSRYGQIHSNAWFSSLNFLAYALNFKPFDLALNAYTVSIYTENGESAGVQVISPDKKAHFIRAKNIIISAGTLETPRILLNSGIDREPVGRYLTNHSFVRVAGQIPRNEFGENLGAIGILKMETPVSPYQIQLSGPHPYFSYQQFEEKKLTAEVIFSQGAFGRVESRAENRVYIDPFAKDEYGVPMIGVEFNYSDQDWRIIRQMSEGILSTASAMGGSLDLPLILSPPGGDFHESCTCRMGVDPGTSVTNNYGQIHGIKGVFVADNSILPTLSAANPTLSTVALSLRVADYIHSRVVGKL